MVICKTLIVLLPSAEVCIEKFPVKTIAAPAAIFQYEPELYSFGCL